MMVKFSEHKMKEVEAIIARYPTGKHKSALIPILHLAQEEFGGWLECRINGLCRFHFIHLIYRSL